MYVTCNCVYNKCTVHDHRADELGSNKRQNKWERGIERRVWMFKWELDDICWIVCADGIVHLYSRFCVRICWIIHVKTYYDKGCVQGTIKYHRFTNEFGQNVSILQKSTVISFLLSLVAFITSNSNIIKMFIII